MQLSQDEIIRYSRHFPVIGLAGQKQLKQASILCVGAGGLGCPALQYLAAAGIGTLGIMDGDCVELSNLQRQILFTEQDIGMNKAMCASKHLKKLNHHTTIHAYTEFLSKEHQSIVEDYDVVLDATDNYEARYLLNEMCQSMQKPLVSASIYQFDAQISVFNYQNGPCYQCLYAEPPPASFSPNCAIGGVLGVLPGFMGTMQANEAIKVILNLSDILSGILLSVDLLSMTFQKFPIEKKDCTAHPRVSFVSIDTEDNPGDYISPSELHQKIQLKDDIQMIDVREPHEHSICHIDGSILIPLHDLPSQIAALDAKKYTVAYCKAGARSAKACKLLLDAGFKKVINLEGGILRWREEIDNSLMLY